MLTLYLRRRSCTSCPYRLGRQNTNFLSKNVAVYPTTERMHDSHTRRKSCILPVAHTLCTSCRTYFLSTMMTLYVLVFIFLLGALDLSTISPFSKCRLTWVFFFGGVFWGVLVFFIYLFLFFRCLK